MYSVRWKTNIKTATDGRNFITRLLLKTFTHWPLFHPLTECFYLSLPVAFCQPFIKLRRRWWWTNSLIYPYGTTKRKIMKTAQTIKDVCPNINRAQAAKIDLDLQTRPIEGQNASSLWTWRKSVQRFPRYYIHKQKKSQTAPKTERYAVHCVR